jgi:hypothetical protein
MVRNSIVKQTQRSPATKLLILFFSLVPCLLSLIGFSSCEYGELEGADRTLTSLEMPGDLPGVWYSHYAEARTDGYRIGLYKNLEEDLGEKLAADFPAYRKTRHTAQDGTGRPDFIDGDEYYIYYDDLGGYGDDRSLRFRFMGVFRAANLFPDSQGAIGNGALIFEYVDGCYPTWTDLLDRPFMAVYYHIINHNTIQMANPVDLEKVYEYLADKTLGVSRYAVETATLEEAIAKFTVENEAEYISWGLVVPQDREP